MANTVKVTKIGEGPNHAVFHVFLRSDGASGNLSYVAIVDPAVNLLPVLGHTPTLTIMEIWYELLNFGLRMDFGSITPTPVWTLGDATSNHVCFDKFGGLKDRSPPLDGNGQLLISTSGFTTTAAQGSFVVRLRKD